MKRMIIGGVEVFVSDCNIAVELTGNWDQDLDRVFDHTPHGITVVQGIHMPQFKQTYVRSAFTAGRGKKSLIFMDHYPMDSFVLLHELGHIFAPQMRGEQYKTDPLARAYCELQADAWAIQRATPQQVMEGYNDLKRLVKKRRDSGGNPIVGEMRLLQFETYLAAKR